MTARQSMSLLLLLAALPLAAAAGCPHAGGKDAADDTIIVAGIPQEAHPSDILEFRIVPTEAGFDYSATVKASPRDQADRYYRYWLGLDWDEEYVDLRIAGTSTYDRASFVGPDSRGNPTWGVFPVEWNGSTMTVRVRFSGLVADAPSNGTVTRLQVLTDGGFADPAAEAPPAGAPYAQDAAAAEIAALPLPCAASASAPPAGPTQPNAVGDPGIGVLALAVTAASIVATVKRRFA